MRSNARIFEKVQVGDKISYQKEKEFLTKQLQKQKAEDQFIKLDFFLLSTVTLGTYQFVWCIHLTNCIKFSLHTYKGMNKISILAVLVTFSLISCVGSYLSRPLDNENGSLHNTKILLISYSLKAIKMRTLFIFTFWVSIYHLNACHLFLLFLPKYMKDV